MAAAVDHGHPSEGRCGPVSVPGDDPRRPRVGDYFHSHVAVDREDEGDPDGLAHEERMAFTFDRGWLDVAEVD